MRSWCTSFSVYLVNNITVSLYLNLTVRRGVLGCYIQTKVTCQTAYTQQKSVTAKLVSVLLDQTTFKMAGRHNRRVSRTLCVASLSQAAVTFDPNLSIQSGSTLRPRHKICRRNVAISLASNHQGAPMAGSSVMTPFHLAVS